MPLRVTCEDVTSRLNMSATQDAVGTKSDRGQKQGLTFYFHDFGWVAVNKFADIRDTGDEAIYPQLVVFGIDDVESGRTASRQQLFIGADHGQPKGLELQRQGEMLQLRRAKRRIIQN